MSHDRFKALIDNRRITCTLVMPDDIQPDSELTVIITPRDGVEGLGDGERGIIVREIGSYVRHQYRNRYALKHIRTAGNDVDIVYYYSISK